MRQGAETAQLCERESSENLGGTQRRGCYFTPSYPCQGRPFLTRYKDFQRSLPVTGSLRYSQAADIVLRLCFLDFRSP